MHLLPVVLVALVLAGCGGGEERPLRVAAASSLREALAGYGGAQLSLGGSDILAARVRAGARPDVIVSADFAILRALERDGLVEPPVPVASNRLVMAVQAGSQRIRSLADTARPGTRVGLTAPTVPAGSYARKALRRLPDGLGREILANVVTEEPDVATLAGKLALGALDAGVVYETEVRAARGRLRSLELPQPPIEYGAAVVRDTPVRDAAREWVEGLVDGDGALAMRRAGLLPPP